jgi:hypothetical protein
VLGTDPAGATKGDLPQPDGDIEYIRRVYESARGWFTTAETKAQLLLTVNGVFITFSLGSVFGKVDEARTSVRAFGPDTWLFAHLRVDPDVPDTYRPEVLWSCASIVWSMPAGHSPGSP